MAGSKKRELMTARQKEFLLLLYDNNNIPISFSEQSIYRSQKWFNEEVRKLIRFKIVNRRTSLKFNMKNSEKIYELTIRGMMFVEQFLIAYNNAVEE